MDSVLPDSKLGKELPKFFAGGHVEYPHERTAERKVIFVFKGECCDGRALVYVYVKHILSAHPDRGGYDCRRPRRDEECALENSVAKLRVIIGFYGAGHVYGHPFRDRLQHLIHAAAHGVYYANAVAAPECLCKKCGPLSRITGVFEEP